MANQEYLRRVKRGVAAWNKWRAKNPRIRPNLVNAEIFARDFSGIDFSRTDLRGANLANSSLIGANLTRANLLSSCIHDADLDNANLTDAKLLGVDLREASLSGANLTRARVDTCNLQDAKLNNANFAEALIGWNTFGNNDLSLTKGLDTVEHWGPSTIGIDTLFLSAGQIPEEFLRGAGIPDTLIAFAHSLVGQAIEVASCFISYSHKDREFAERLHSRLRDAHIRVWFAPENTRGGEKLYEQIERAIQMHDRLLIVLSGNSIDSEWVMTEIRNARNLEIEEKRRKLFPIRLVDFNTIRVASNKSPHPL